MFGCRVSGGFTAPHVVGIVVVERCRSAVCPRFHAVQEIESLYDCYRAAAFTHHISVVIGGNFSYQF